MRIVIALAILLISMPAMAEERSDEGSRRRRTRSVDSLAEQAIRDIRLSAEARRRVMDKASLEMTKELFRKAREADKAENWAAAYSHYYDVSNSRAPGSYDLAAQSRFRLHELDGVAEERIRQARKKERSRKYLEALNLYRAISMDFGFSRHADDARRRMAALVRSNASVPALILAEAEALEKAKEHLSAKSRYKHLAVRYPNSVEAVQAAKKLKKYNKDIYIKESLKASLEREARMKAPVWLNMSDNCLKNKMPERAHYYLDMIIERYPDTEWAKKAKAKKEKLGERTEKVREKGAF